MEDIGAEADDHDDKLKTVIPIRDRLSQHVDRAAETPETAPGSVNRRWQR